MRLTISREDDGADGGRYVARAAGERAEAELVYSRPGPDIVSADHTGVPDAWSGHGVGGALVDALVADARSEGFRILPRCPFVRARYASHPEWSDVFATPPDAAR
ncbi:MAG: N-acetyltransferase [Rhodoblastus sp.]|nr:MAG: N-acetyltransferase [Rhodoblastus sp.]